MMPGFENIFILQKVNSELFILVTSKLFYDLFVEIAIPFLPRLPFLLPQMFDVVLKPIFDLCELMLDVFVLLLTDDAAFSKYA
jgi:hypothetical protein